jgi:hypothetical protein
MWGVDLHCCLSGVIGTVSARAFTTSNQLKTPAVRLMAGPDSSSSTTTVPSARVTIEPTHYEAKISFSLFKSASNNPQPATYYINLMQLNNCRKVSYTINSITISDITGASNLGRLTIYLFAVQTDTPTASTPIGSASLTNTSHGTISLLSSTQTIAASATYYIEIVGHAAPSAGTGSKTGFNLNIQCMSTHR